MRRLLHSLSALALAFAVAAVAVRATGGSPLEAFQALGHGAFGDSNSVLRTLAKSTPLILSGLAVAVALRAGMFNIGAEGQLLVGGIAAAWVGASCHGLAMAIHLPLAIAAGAMAGGLWAAVPGVLKAWRGSHEVIVTIMMNYIAIELTRYLVNHPLLDSNSLTNPNRAPQTAPVLASAQLWSMGGGANFSAGFGLALVMAVVVAWMIKRTALGFEIRAVGANPDAARTAGIRVGRTYITAMVISGALAGLAGTVEVLAVHHRFVNQFSPGYGFDSIAVAFLGNLSALGVTLSALLFGALNSGAINMEAMTETPRQIAGIVQAVVIMAVGVRYVRTRRRQ